MRIFKLSGIAIMLMFLVSCGNSENNSCQSSPELYHQDIEQLYITPEKAPEHINYNVQHARWISYLEYSDIMLNKSEKEFTDYIIKMLENAKSDDINTIYFHSRAFGDSYYKSELFPQGTFLNQNYDPLKIIITEAHKLDISVHAWVNPLRCQTAEEFVTISDDFTTKKWFNEFQGTYICNVDGRMWLNPAYDEVTDFISDGILEIIRNYDVDGIHIDDYFYPSADENFDKSAFSDSGQDNLNQWRIDNINRLVSEIYSEIKNYDDDILFGISPQGNIDIDYNSQFADVKTWCSNSGYCDYIVPQIYFGFKNDTCPFEQTFQQWYDMTKNSDISLVIGLAVYKEGKEDKWAGSGKNEWIEDSDVIQKQKDFIAEYENTGYSLYY
ncbi:MAG: family 10 glycosylhydrolase [Oscillospiraceae bacterium]|nr:family 10 glycosylhydrolase [Oscillospiraceae bacterium]